MKKNMALAIVAPVAALGFAFFASGPAQPQGSAPLLEGKAAFTDWHADRPGLVRHIRPADMPAANLAASLSNGVRIVRRGANDKPIVPPGFAISLFAEGLDEPRLIRAMATSSSPKALPTAFACCGRRRAASRAARSLRAGSARPSACRSIRSPARYGNRTTELVLAT
jgi:hypothetical protein